EVLVKVQRPVLVYPFASAIDTELPNAPRACICCCATRRAGSNRRFTPMTYRLFVFRGLHSFDPQPVFFVPVFDCASLRSTIRDTSRSSSTCPAAPLCWRLAELFEYSRAPTSPLRGGIYRLRAPGG